MQINYDNKVSEELKRFINQGFSDHAISEVGSDGEMQALVFTFTDEEKVLGAVVAKTFWGGLHIKNLYVSPDARGRGIGRELMNAACVKGKELGCRFAFVETMSFQALDFYQKLGFELEFTRPGYDHGVSFHYLNLRL